MFEAIRGASQNPTVQQTASQAVQVVDDAAQAAQRVNVGPGTQRLIEGLEAAGPAMEARIEAVARWLPEGQRALMTTLEGGARMLSGGAGARARQVILNPDGSTVVKAFNVARETWDVVKVITPQ
jgi:hypothetical protein